ncbi:HlyD family secretion protein [Caminicella sporogenes]|uniref:HlyD family secretion protein n=1 Tax=Caminicella sporogenes TaxID=166485 RepID=UPI00254257D0|nr:efflux RND transporter periplasmic adaptor subunit [Caminicella sporogenes]WIF94768.1 HlyD family efflux transporter periplasmic adaptor subunit [Caminicella sporogenes]
MKKIVIVLLILNVFLTSCSINFDNSQSTYTGTIEAEEIKVSSQIGGIVENIFVEEGQKITIGDRIADIDVKDLKIQLKKAENQLKIAKTKLEEILDGTRSEKIKAAKANTEKIKAQLEGARKNYEYRLENYNDLKQLYNKGVVSKQQLKDSKAVLDLADANLKSIEKQYKSSIAELNLLLNGATEKTIKTAQLEVKRAEIEIDQLKNQIDKCSIKSPIDGVVQTLNFKKGELISKGAVIATIINTNNLWLKIYIPEKELHKIKLGEEINIFTNFENKKIIKGKVVYISSEAEFVPKNVESKESKEEMVFEVKIKLFDKDNDLKPGMLADVKLGVNNK